MEDEEAAAPAYCEQSEEGDRGEEKQGAGGGRSVGLETTFCSHYFDMTTKTAGTGVVQALDVGSVCT